MSDRDNTYFAANEDPNKVASICLQKAQTFFNVLNANSYLEKIHRMWRFYYAAQPSDMSYGHRVDFTGEQGEFVNIYVNHFRNIAQHILVMITATRPSVSARAINTDYKSLAQTYLANGILDYYMREKNLEDCLKKAVEMAIVMGSGYIKLEWNATSGEQYEYDEESGQYTYEGEIEFTNLSQFDVVVDGTKESWNNDWVVTRTFKNRYDLMAKYPEHADRIRGLPSKASSTVYRLGVWSNDDTDDVPVYEFYHKRTDALPEGRYMLFLSEDIILLDTKLPYRVIPVFRIVAGEILGTPYGYSPMFDVAPLQECINALYSTIMTNQNAFGVQNLYVPRGADINVNSLDGAMNIIEGNAKPEALNLTETPKEVFEFLDFLIKSAEMISGVNSVARGAPEASLRSGTALALVQAQALQFVSGLQASYVKLIENVSTSMINILKDYATTPKVVALVGKNNRPFLKEFVGEDLDAINRVVVDMTNPLSRTTAGKMEIAQQMLQMGVIKRPEQFFQVLETGRLDMMYEGEMNELLLIKSENEALLEGTPVITSPLDDHRLHINEHKAVLSDPDLRRDHKLVANTLDHIQEHMQMLSTTDPNLLMLVGQQPLPPPQQPPPGPDQGPQGPPGGAPGPQGGPAQIANVEAAPGPIKPGQQVQGPGESNQPLPGPSKVKASLLPNPELQQQAMGNVRPNQ